MTKNSTRVKKRSPSPSELKTSSPKQIKLEPLSPPLQPLPTTSIAKNDSPEQSQTSPTSSQPSTEPISTLNRVFTITTNNLADPPLTPITVVNFRCSVLPEKIPRLRTFEVLPTTAGYAANLATANPALYHLGPRNSISRRPSQKPQHFFLIGTVRESQLFRAGPRQLIVNFSDYTFERAMAVIGEIFGTNVLYLPTFLNGVPLSTYKSAGNTSTGLGLTTSSKLPAGNKTRVSANAPSTLPYDEDVPVFDGTKSFKPKDIPNLPTFDQEFARNSVVLVGFTVTTWDMKEAKNFKLKTTKKALSFNYQFAVLLENPVSYEQVDSSTASDQPLAVSAALDYSIEDDDITVHADSDNEVEI